VDSLTLNVCSWPDDWPTTAPDPTAVGRDRPLSCSLASQVASVFSAAGRFISAASLGQRELSRSYIARAPWRTFGILGPPTELAIHPSACHRPS
jgi:hypothetical protein